jgi:UDP-glucose 4-epimerase
MALLARTLRFVKTVLLTGVAGFIGRHVARQFARAGWRVVGVDAVAPENAQLSAGTLYHRMQLPSAGLAELLRAVPPDACVHCAGRASVPFSMEDPAADFRDNTVLTFELLETLRTTAPRCRLLLLSSAAVYGNPASLPVAETHRTAPLSPYGYHKLQCELLCEEFSRIYALPTTIARIFSAYGPGLRRQVVWDICERALSDSPLTLHGTGRESRDFIHASDIARALVLLAEKGGAEADVYNLASGEETSIAALAELLLGALLRETRPTFDGSATPGNPLSWRADIAKIGALGFATAITLEQGLRSVATWCAAELSAP